MRHIWSGTRNFQNFVPSDVPVRILMELQWPCTKPMQWISNVLFFRIWLDHSPSITNWTACSLIVWIFLGSRRYHKACHKCCLCGKLLAPGKAHMHNGDPHCRFELLFAIVLSEGSRNVCVCWYLFFFRTCHAAAIQPASPALFPDTTTIKLDHHDYIVKRRRWRWCL